MIRTLKASKVVYRKEIVAKWRREAEKAIRMIVSRPLDHLCHCYLGFCDDHLSWHPDTRERHGTAMYYKNEGQGRGLKDERETKDS